MAAVPAAPVSDERVPDDLVVIGRFTAVYGVKGWLKVYSYTDPMENILNYRRYLIFRRGERQPLLLAEGRRHGKGLVVRLEGVDDRDAAATFVGCEVAIPADELPRLAPDEFYWRELEGLQVVVDHPQRGPLVLGAVDHLLETGANDVLVVKATAGSIDQRERLIPYLPGRVVLDVDLAARILRVDWDPDF